MSCDNCNVREGESRLALFPLRMLIMECGHTMMVCRGCLIYNAGKITCPAHNA